MDSSENRQGKTSYEFFKIISEDNVSNNVKLELPRKFVRLYGESLPCVVYLRVQRGVLWRVRVAKRVGEAFFEQGWPEFSNHFSIAHGQLLFFRYQGNDKFHISICDKTMCQIDYPESSVTGTSYQFFEIILEDTLSNGIKLELPMKFVRLYGESLPSIVYLRVQCGVFWRVRVAKRVGETSFEQGWPEFSNHFSIAHGQLLFFRYQGNDKFHVSICDKTMCQIDYPESSVVETDGVVHGLDDDAESEMGYPINEDSERSDSETGSNNMGDKPKGGKGRLVESFKGTKAFREASHFTSKYPFFRATINNSSWFSLRIPGRFGKGHFEQRNQVVRVEVGKRSWNLLFRACATGYFLGAGYAKLVKDNSLRVGDFCIYELIRRNRVTLRVSIFRQNAC